ncbi:MAG: nucleotide exchange factor GrpE, partial [Polaribacter sp.]
MSKKEDIKDEKVNNNQEEIQVEENQEVVEEFLKEEATIEELIQEEKDKFLRLFAEFENFKKRPT